MVKVHPTANKVHVLVDTYLPPRSTPDMLATFRLPVEVETHISGEQAQRICDRIGYTGQTRAEAQGRGYFVFLEDGAGDGFDLWL